jgi:hypothetical protein
MTSGSNAGSRRERVVAAGTLGVGLTQVALGVWMAASPGSFFDVIGGFGAFNDHYLRDVATFYLAIGIALVIAARRPAWRVPVLWLAVLQYAFHVVNHVVDVGDAEPSWVGPLDVGLLVLAAAAFALLLAAASERRRST